MDEMITISEANKNLSKVLSKVDQEGQVILTANNKPKYLIIDLENNALIEMSDEEKIMFVAERILREHKKAFIELAK